MNLIRSALAALASLALSIPAVAQEVWRHRANQEIRWPASSQNNTGSRNASSHWRSYSSACPIWAAALRDMWEPFIQDMRRETGLKINAFYATDYTGVIEAQRFNKVQVAWYGNKSAIEAVDRANGEVFAQFIDLHGTPGYYSYVITHRDSGIASLEDMFAKAKGLTYGSGDPQSTSGTLVPGFYVFAQRGLEAKDVFKVTRPASHGVNLLAAGEKVRAAPQATGR